MNSDKTLSNAELELTQKIQMHFPRGIISSEMLKQWNICRKEAITDRLAEAFSKGPEIVFSKTDILLEFLGTVNIPANPGKFIVKDYFRVNTGDDASVKISWLGSNLQEWFLDVVEDPSEAMTLSKSNLRKASVDTLILDEFGGHDRVASTWFSIWHLLFTDQLDKKKWYVFYIEDEIRSKEDKTVAFTNAKGQKVVLRAVGCFWRSDGWDVGAGSVEGSGEWYGGGQVFSRNSPDS